MVRLIILIIKKTYKDRISEIENKLFNTENSKIVNLYKEYIKKLKEILFEHDTSDIKENKNHQAKD